MRGRLGRWGAHAGLTRPQLPTTQTAPAAPLRLLQRQGGTALRLAILAPLLSGLLLVGQAWLLAEVVGRGVGGETPVTNLLPAIAGVAALLLARAALGALGEQAGARAAEAIKLHLRDVLFSRQMLAPPRRGDAPASGAVAAAIIDQVEALDGYFARYLPAAIQAGLLPLIFGAIILPLDWVAGLLFLGTAPLIPLFMALVGWGAQAASDSQAAALTRLSSRFADRLSGLLTLKLLGRAEVETAGMALASEALRRRTMRVLRIAFLSSAVLEFFAALGVAGIALYVGLTFIDFLHLRAEPLTLQLGLFLLLMAPEVYNPLRQLATHYHDKAAARAALGEIALQLGDIPADRAALHDCPALPGPALGVAMERLSLRTPDGLRTLLADVTFRVRSGQHVALLGESGIGKSSLLEAIAGLRPVSGDITLEGKPLSDWSDTELRGRTYLLSQKPRIVHATLAENIALGRPGATRREIERAAELACVTPFATALSDGLDSLVGESGAGLSGGQIQRVALARVFLRDAGLILLDEPTAHLDPDTEAEVVDNLRRYGQGRTLIVATHSFAVAGALDAAWRIAGGALLPAPIPGVRRAVA